VKLPEAEKTETGVAPRSTAKSPEAGISPEPPKTPPAISVAKDETESIQAAAPEAPAPVEEKTVEKPAPEQLASIPKPIEATVEKSALARPVPKPLEGFIIQIAFRDKEKAQSWAEKMAQRGYAVSVTAAGSEGSLRVRLGNFGLRDEAERQLKNFKQDGMNGIIINLPQAFRPGAASSVP
jgi:cell division protein FtsN